MNALKRIFNPKIAAVDVTGAVGGMSSTQVPGNLGAQANATQAQQLAQTTKKSIVEGFAGHFKKSLLTSVTRAGVHTGFQAAQGQTQTAAGTIGGVGANRIGASYQNHTLDPLSHKTLHGILGGLTGGILNGADGARAGALAAVLSETMAEALSPQIVETSDDILAGATSQTEYDVAFSAYLHHQKDLVLLTTAAIIAGLGEDVNTAIQTADNALSHNSFTVLKLAIQATWNGAKTLGKFVWQKTSNKTGSFFSETHYSQKVLTQMGQADLHAFPERVKAFEKNRYIKRLRVVME